jgi:hypothetical protein
MVRKSDEMTNGTKSQILVFAIPQGNFVARNAKGSNHNASFLRGSIC